MASMQPQDTLESAPALAGDTLAVVDRARDTDAGKDLQKDVKKNRMSVNFFKKKPVVAASEPAEAASAMTGAIRAVDDEVQAKKPKNGFMSMFSATLKRSRSSTVELKAPELIHEPITPLVEAVPDEKSETASLADKPIDVAQEQLSNDISDALLPSEDITAESLINESPVETVPVESTSEETPNETQVAAPITIAEDTPLDNTDSKALEIEPSPLNDASASALYDETPTKVEQESTVPSSRNDLFSPLQTPKNFFNKMLLKKTKEVNKTIAQANEVIADAAAEVATATGIELPIETTADEMHAEATAVETPMKDNAESIYQTHDESEEAIKPTKDMTDVTAVDVPPTVTSPTLLTHKKRFTLFRRVPHEEESTKTLNHIHGKDEVKSKKEEQKLGDVVKAGYLLKQGSLTRAITRRHVTLYSSGVVHAALHSSANTPKVFAVTANSIVSIPTGPGVHIEYELDIVVVPSRRVIGLVTSSPEEQEAWKAAFESVINSLAEKHEAIDNTEKVDTNKEETSEAVQPESIKVLPPAEIVEDNTKTEVPEHEVTGEQEQVTAIEA